MDIELIYRVSSITAIVAALVAAIAGGTQWWSGSVISSRQEVKITTLEKDSRIKKPSIFSQKIISQNIPDKNLFIQKYLVSINSPVQYVPLYTYIQFDRINGDIERVGAMEYNDVGGGVRSVEGQDVSYVNTEYTLKTSRILSGDEKIVFSLEKHPDMPIGK